jgi:hypothetical protein
VLACGGKIRTHSPTSRCARAATVRGRSQGPGARAFLPHQGRRGRILVTRPGVEPRRPAVKPPDRGWRGRRARAVHLVLEAGEQEVGLGVVVEQDAALVRVRVRVRPNHNPGSGRRAGCPPWMCRKQCGANPGARGTSQKNILPRALGSRPIFGRERCSVKVNNVASPWCEGTAHRQSWRAMVVNTVTSRALVCRNSFVFSRSRISTYLAPSARAHWHRERRRHQRARGYFQRAVKLARARCLKTAKKILREDPTTTRRHAQKCDVPETTPENEKLRKSPTHSSSSASRESTKENPRTGKEALENNHGNGDTTKRFTHSSSSASCASTKSE